MDNMEMTKRSGCYVCRKVLGKFQYRVVGLCNQCRSAVSTLTGVDRSKVSMFSIPGCNPCSNLEGGMDGLQARLGGVGLSEVDSHRRDSRQGANDCVQSNVHELR